MVKTLIVLAHPDKASFNGQWAETSRAASTALGHDVELSDLVTMGFDPVERADHYQLPDMDPFDVLRAQEAAAAAKSLPNDVVAEIAKIEAADRIIFHFPMWWFGPPAILKGWFDRVLANGAMHNTDERFDTGRCRHKTALFCVTTGSSAVQSAPDGKEGNAQMLLWPLSQALRYLGFSVLRPIMVSGVHSYHKDVAADALAQRLSKTLADQPKIIADYDNLPRLHFNTDGDFTKEGRLKPDAPSHSDFIRHIGR